MFLSIVFALAQGAPPPGPSNPWCQSAPSEFYPYPTLPECANWDVNCLFACADLWQTEMHLAYEWGCSRWAIADARYLTKRTESEESYMNCLTMTAPEQQYQCTELYDADMQSLHDGLDYERDHINAGVSSRIATATESFLECAASCCNDQGLQ